MLVSGKRLEELRDYRNEMREANYEKVLPIVGEDIINALRELLNIYDENIFIWLAKLWDPDVGGFYYSNSARDNEGFLPDLESTGQALQFIIRTGLCKSPSDIPENIRSKMINFARELQDPDDGLFYLPQWGKNVTVARRGRDLSWAIQIIKGLGAEMKYASPADSASEKHEAKRAAHFTSPDAFRSYLHTLENDPNSRLYLKKHSWYVGNLLNSQAPQIKAAGREYVRCLEEFIERNQYSHNGLWEEEITYSSVSGLMKIATLCSAVGAFIPNAERALESAFQMALSRENPRNICEIYNPLSAMSAPLNCIKTYGSREQYEYLRGKIMEKGADIISVAREEALLFKKPDGSFSYTPTHSVSSSQDAPVSIPHTNEGDVNASKIAISSILGNCCEMFEIQRLPIFTEEDGKLFFEIMNNAKCLEKQ